MKSEYLVTFDSNDRFCANVSDFKSLLSTHESISFVRDKIAYLDKNYTYQLAQGTLTDGSIYYDLTIECPERPEIEKFSEFLREIRGICAKLSGRKIIILHDGIGEYYCQSGYPIIYKTENLMRKLIAKFMAISIGYNWSDAATPKEVLDSVRTDKKKEKTNFLHEIDFIQLSNFLFKSYTKSDASRFFDTIKGKDDAENITVKDLKQYAPFTNWEKYFSKKVNCESDYLKAKWERLYEYRCKIAHCKGISKQELDDLNVISKAICQKIQAALDAVGDLHIEETDREELAENLSGTASKESADFIGKYNKLSALVRSICEFSSSEDDIFNKHETNKTNIRMQSNYLWSTKGIITKKTANLINKAQKTRNTIVHKVGLVEINESYFDKEMEDIDALIETLSSLDRDGLLKKRGIDLRSQQMRE